MPPQVLSCMMHDVEQLLIGELSISEHRTECGEVLASWWSQRRREIEIPTWSKPPRRTRRYYGSVLTSTIMSSRISIARPQSNNYNSDPHGLSNSRASTGYRSANPDDPLEKLQALSKTVEDHVEIYSQPLKPHLPAIGRFLIVVTFLEDALRILTQWSDQIWYLQQ